MNKKQATKGTTPSHQAMYLGNHFNITNAEAIGINKQSQMLIKKEIKKPSRNWVFGF
jgi:hypothetical protein